jgi:hypothetical protein
MAEVRDYGACVSLEPSSTTMSSQCGDVCARTLLMARCKQ